MFSDNVNMCKASSTLVGLKQSLINCQWSSTTYDASIDFSLFSVGGGLAESFPCFSDFCHRGNGLVGVFTRWLNLARPIVDNTRQKFFMSFSRQFVA